MESPTPRKRARCKTPPPIVDVAALPRHWRLVDGVPRLVDKVSEWYKHRASLQDVLPLSHATNNVRQSLSLLPERVTLASVRPLFNKIPGHPAHSRKKDDGFWMSLSAESMGTHYEDAILHMVGYERMKEWWEIKPYEIRSSNAVGLALTFWFCMGDGPPWFLPDAIEEGLKSTELAEFQDVWCLTYQRIENMPPHIKVVPCSKVLPVETFHAVLAHGTMQLDSFIAVFAEWIKQVAADSLPGLQNFQSVTTFDGDSIWLARALPPQRAFGHAAATLEVNRASFENMDMNLV